MVAGTITHAVDRMVLLGMLTVRTPREMGTFRKSACRKNFRDQEIVLPIIATRTGK